MADKRPKWGEHGYDDDSVDDSVDVDHLEEQREAVSRDKADLFDFYHNNWPRVIEELRQAQELIEEHRQQGMDGPQ